MSRDKMAIRSRHVRINVFLTGVYAAIGHFRFYAYRLKMGVSTFSEYLKELIREDRRVELKDKGGFLSF